MKKVLVLFVLSLVVCSVVRADEDWRAKLRRTRERMQKITVVVVKQEKYSPPPVIISNDRKTSVVVVKEGRPTPPIVVVKKQPRAPVVVVQKRPVVVVQERKKDGLDYVLQLTELAARIKHLTDDNDKHHDRGNRSDKKTVVIAPKVYKNHSKINQRPVVHDKKNDRWIVGPDVAIPPVKKSERRFGLYEQKEEFADRKKSYVGVERRFSF